MAKIVTILNFKGGVGKTTCAVEIAVSLARFYGRRALLIDLDPQASATFYLMEQERWRQWREVHGSTFNLFEQNDHRFYIRNAIVPDVVQGRTAVFGFDLLPSDPNLVDIDLRLSDFIGYTVLQRYLDEIRDEYDYIICDCPPNFNPVTKNSLWASDAYIVPTIPDFLSTYGIGLLQRSINKLFAPTYHTVAFTGPVLGGIILTRIKTNTRLHATYCEQVRYDYPGKVFKHMISDSIAVAAAADDRMPISAIKSPSQRQAELQGQFRDIAGEFISRIQHLRMYGRSIRVV
jgi:chromosome partitioning protein